MASPSLRWGRIVLGGFLAELVLFVPVIAANFAGGGERAITVVAVAGSYVVFVPVTWLMTRRLARPVLHGALMGAAAAAIYVITGVVAGYFQATAATPFIYYVAHVLKMLGGATGGWLAQRSAAPTVSSPAPTR